MTTRLTGVVLLLPAVMLLPAGMPPAGGITARPVSRPGLGLFQPANNARYELAGRRARYAIQYYGWGEGFQAADAVAARRAGAVVFAELQTCGNPCYTTPVSLAAVTAGRYDGYLARFARAVRRFGHRVLMTFDHEMNGSWYPWGYQGSEHVGPARWIAAWDHVTQVVSAIAGRYVTWVWAPNVVPGAAPPAWYWPGQHVGWVGLDGYYQGPGSTWASTFAASWRAVEAVSGHRPFIVAETGVPAADRDRATQLANLVAGAQRVRALAVMYFDATRWSLTPRTATELASRLGTVPRRAAHAGKGPRRRGRRGRHPA